MAVCYAISNTTGKHSQSCYMKDFWEDDIPCKYCDLCAAPWCSRVSLQIQSWHQTWAPFHVPVISFLTQLPDYGLESSKGWFKSVGPCSHMGVPEASGSWLLISQAPVIETMAGVNQSKDLCLFSLCALMLQVKIKSYFIKKMQLISISKHNRRPECTKLKTAGKANVYSFT